jgi:uncharacterized protein YgiM (DUF1202 family)
MTAEDLIFASARGTAAEAKTQAAARGAQGPYQSFIDEIFQEAPALGIDPCIAVSQSSVETGTFTSDYWINDRNPGGVGITYDGAPSPFDRQLTGEEAARVMLLEIWIHTEHGATPGALADVEPLYNEWVDLLRATVADPGYPTVTRIKHLNIHWTNSGGFPECSWACDPQYATKIVNNGNILFPSLTDSETTNFFKDDKLRVTDDDVNMRGGPATSFGIVGTLDTGNLVCVIDGPRTGSGFTWYDVKRTDGLTGWVATVFLEMNVSGGCANVPSDPEDPKEIKPGIVNGDFVRVLRSTDLREYRRGMTTTVVAVLQAGQVLQVTGRKPTTADGFDWWETMSRHGRGYVKTVDVEETSANNLALNSTTDAGTANLTPNRPQVQLSSVKLGNNNRIKVVCPGTQTFEGVRFNTISNLSMSGRRYFTGTIDITGSGDIEGAGILVRYTDGTQDIALAKTFDMSTTKWRRLIFPRIVTNKDKTVAKVELHCVHAPAEARTYHIDNGRIVQLT